MLPSITDHSSGSAADTIPSPALMNWSGGKDAALCLHRVLGNGSPRVRALLTTVNEHYRRVTQHGVRVELLEQQAEEIGLPLRIVSMPQYPSMDTYDRLMEEALRTFKARGVTTAIYGDILLEDVRAYREERLAALGFSGIFPLWEQSTDGLIRECLAAGFKATVVCVNDQHLDKSFAGRELDEAFLADLPPNVDPCGENGEFHTFVYDGPIFDRPVPFERGDLTHRTYEPPEDEDSDRGSDYTCGTDDDQNLQETGFWFCDLLPAAA